MHNKLALAVAISLAGGLSLAHTEAVARQHDHESQQMESSAGQGASERIVTSETMDQQDLYEQGISLEGLLGGDVVDDSGNTVGDVEDFVISPDSSRVVGLVIATGGFLGIGDNHLLYPFAEASIRGKSEVQADVSSSTAGELSLFKEIEGQSLKMDRSRATEILGGLAYSDGEPYGRVNDLIVNSAGDILAVVVQADVSYDDDSLYAWPNVGFTDDVYDVPADERYAFGQEPLDRDGLRGAQADSQ